MGDVVKNGVDVGVEVGQRGRLSVTDSPETSADPSDESVIHWRNLRETVEVRIRRLEADLRGATWSERRHERLLRMRRLHAKLGSRERLALTVSSLDPSELRRA